MYCTAVSLSGTKFYLSGFDLSTLEVRSVRRSALLDQRSGNDFQYIIYFKIAKTLFWPHHALPKPASVSAGQSSSKPRARSTQGYGSILHVPAAILNVNCCLGRYGGHSGPKSNSIKCDYHMFCMESNSTYFRRHRTKEKSLKCKENFWQFI